MNRLILAVGVAAIGAACSNSSTNDQVGSPTLDGSAILPTTVVLAPGASAQVAGANLSIHFDSVTSDSRCPATVQCVWAGEATVALTVGPITGFTIVQAVRLSTTAGKDTATAFGQPIRLLNVQPSRTVTSPLPQSTYRIELKVGADK